jgi:ribosomal protein S12 methylthiotransferase
LKSVSFISLGCPKNLVDSEVILGRLAQAGYAVCEDYEDSDVVVINTCGFLQEARSESIEVVERAVKLRDEGKIRGVVVAGCLPQRDPGDALTCLSRADAILGVNSREHIVETCDALLAEAPPPKLRVTSDLPRYEIDRDRLRLTPRHFAYVRLSEGCSHTCAFCIIPKIKGRFRSKPVEVLLDEARELAADGARELNLIAQDTTSYGLDLYKRLTLPELLAELAKVDGIEWIRLLYCYPSYVTARLIRAVAEIPKVVKYMDMPIQHTTEAMLRRMRRGVTEGSQRELIGALRAGIPDLVMRTTLIVGFPGETEQDFEQLCSDVRELRFERLGVFRYSDEPGTRAMDLGDRVPEAVKEERFHRIMQIQQEVARDVNRRFVGRTIPASVDGPGVGRSYGDAPDVDGTVSLDRRDLEPGRIVSARITRVRGYDLEGVVA